jgi:hypothetical protein
MTDPAPDARLRVYGPIQPGLAPPRPERIALRTRPTPAQAFAESLVRGLAIAISAFCLVYVAAELARPILERIF